MTCRLLCILLEDCLTFAVADSLKLTLLIATNIEYNDTCFILV